MANFCASVFNVANDHKFSEGGVDFSSPWAVSKPQPGGGGDKQKKIRPIRQDFAAFGSKILLEGGEQGE